MGAENSNIKENSKQNDKNDEILYDLQKELTKQRPGQLYNGEAYRNKSKEFLPNQTGKPIQFHVQLVNIEPDEPLAKYQIELRSYLNDKFNLIWKSRRKQSTSKHLYIKANKTFMYSHLEDQKISVIIQKNEKKIIENEKNKTISVKDIVNSPGQTLRKEIFSDQLQCSMEIIAVDPIIYDQMEKIGINLTLKKKYQNKSDYSIFICFYFKYKNELSVFFYKSDPIMKMVNYEGNCCEFFIPKNLFANDDITEYEIDVNISDNSDNNFKRFGTCKIQKKINLQKKEKLKFMSIDGKEEIGEGKIELLPNDVLGFD